MPPGRTLLLAAPRAMGRPKARHNGLRADEQVANRVLEAVDIAQRQLVGRRLDGGLVVMPGVPGFPPGAAWNGDGTDALFNASTHHDSQPDSWSGGLSSFWLHARKA